MTPWQVIEADCVKAMAAMGEASVDAIVTDPPYGLEFMGKDWDRPWAVSPTSSVGFEGREDNLTLPSHRDGRNANCRRCGGRARGAKRCECAAPAWDRAPAQDMRDFQQWCEEWAREALRVLKPGGHLLAFGGTRTSHRLACAIEDAGFEIRDTICWLYGSGFPKSLDVSKAIDKAAGVEREVVGHRAQFPDGDRGAQPRPSKFPNAYGDGMPDPGLVPITAPATPDAERWQGWGTALKPAHEPIVVARKPLAGTVAANVLEHGTGALNVDGCRIEGVKPAMERTNTIVAANAMAGESTGATSTGEMTTEGRWPANVVLDEQAAAMLDEQTGDLHASGNHGGTIRPDGGYGGGWGTDPMPVGFPDSGGASRFFYVAKASSAERNAGLDGFEAKGQTDDGYGSIQTPKLDRATPRENWTPHPVRNVHPTVKPIALMRWLVRLVSPPGGLVLDPFTGSGTTGCAAVLEGVRFVGIERETEYAEIARARIAWWAEHPEGVELVDRLDAEQTRRAVADAGQLQMFGKVFEPDPQVEPETSPQVEVETW